MNKVLILAALAVAVPCAVFAQVEKKVEVTKAYVPSLESAAKLAVTPDMTDTVKMRPEIDYSITPLSLATSLETRPIRPASVTYWQFNRPRTLYLKAGAGYPLNSVLDFYAASQNPGTGYVVGYLNHEGRYADIRNDFDRKNNSVRMFNRVGVAAGKYFGKRTLEGELSYDNRLYHRYGSFVSGPPVLSIDLPGSALDYGDLGAAFRFGDDFKDLSRTNFEVGIRGSYFSDHTEHEFADGALPEYTEEMLPGNMRQTTLAAGAKIARGWGRSSLSFDAGYQWLQGRYKEDKISQHTLRVGARYGLEGGVVKLDVGADYYYDRITEVEGRHYIVPFAHLDLNLGTGGLKPFIEVDGQVRDNSFRSLARQNPYLSSDLWLDRSSVDYNGRFGVGGSLWKGKLSYRLFAAFSIHDYHLYWYNIGHEDVFVAGVFYADQARQTVTSFSGEAEYRPLSSLLINVGVHGYIYNDDTQLENGEPAFRGNVGVRYDGRKIAFGVGVQMQSARKWSVLDGMPDSTPTRTFDAPFACDLRVNFDWKVSGSVTLFAEGRNLLNGRLYEYAFFPEYGANCTVGVRMNF